VQKASTNERRACSCSSLAGNMVVRKSPDIVHTGEWGYIIESGVVRT
jgi:hypothetical protein